MTDSKILAGRFRHHLEVATTSLKEVNEEDVRVHRNTQEQLLFSIAHSMLALLYAMAVVGDEEE